MSNIEQKQDENKNAISRFVNELLCTKKSIGDLNGKWAVMLKMAVVIVTLFGPLVLAWGIWVTNYIFLTQQYLNEACLFEERLVEAEKTLILAPEAVKDNEEDINILKTDVKSMSKSNDIDHRNIMVELSKIQAKLEILEQK